MNKQTKTSKTIPKKKTPPLRDTLQAAKTKCLDTVFSWVTAEASISRYFFTAPDSLFVHFSWPLN